MPAAANVGVVSSSSELIAIRMSGCAPINRGLTVKVNNSSSYKPFDVDIIAIHVITCAFF